MTDAIWNTPTGQTLAESNREIGTQRLFALADKKYTSIPKASLHHCQMHISLDFQYWLSQTQQQNLRPRDKYRNPQKYPRNSP